MHLLNITKNLGILLTALSTTMLPPIGVALWYKENTIFAFLLSGICFLTLGLSLWWPVRNKQQEPHIKDGFLIVTIFWLTLSLVSTLPLSLITKPKISLVDAIFECVAGLTATGSSVLMTLESLPKSIIYYRQQLQFLGGMGIVILGVAIFPALGIGGLQLFKSEISSANRDNKLMPRISQIAKSLWLVYLTLSILCTISYWAAGMSLFDAICYSFGTISTGGFAPHDQGIAYFDSRIIQLISIIFMILGATNFSLHFLTLQHGNIKHYLTNDEFIIFLIIICIATAIASITLIHFHTIPHILDTVLQGLFHVTSFCTTTGFNGTPYDTWPVFLPAMLMLLGVLGGCTGSTSGGLKIFRFLMLFKQGSRELKQLIHPQGFYIIKYGKTPISDRTINSIWGFLATYMALFTVFWLLLLATGLDFMSSYSAVAASLSNFGNALGSVVYSYHDISNPAKIILSIAMIIGRLELFTVLALFMPAYWRE